MARLLKQSDDIRQDFYRRIREKIQRDKDEYLLGIRRNMPFLSGMIGGFAGLMFDIDQMLNQAKGSAGEHLILRAAARALSDIWLIAQDAIFEPQPDVFTQIDHVFISPSGVFLVETKAWDGAYRVRGDRWERKDRYRWVRCQSPTIQADYHRYMWLWWVHQHISKELFHTIAPHVHPLIVLTNVAWIKVERTPIMIFPRANYLMNHLLSQKQNVIGESEIAVIARLIALQPRYNPDCQVPHCPKCHRPMALREAKQGPFQGQWFYGCPNYPACRETRAMESGVR